MGFSIGSAGGFGGPRGVLEGHGGEKVDGKAFDSKIVTRLLSFVVPYWFRMTLAFVAMIVGSVLTLVTPYLVKVAIDGPIAQNNQDDLNQIVILLLLVFIGVYVANVVQRMLLSWVGQKVLADLRESLFVHLQDLSLGYHDKNIIGVTISRVISDVGVINQLLSQGLVTLIGDTFLLVGIVIAMVSMSWELALVTFSVVPVMVIITVLFARQAGEAFRSTRAKVALVIAEMAENLSGMRVIQAFAQEDTSSDKFDSVNAENRDAHINAMTLAFIFLPSVEFLAMVATGIVLLFGGLSVSNGNLTIGVVVAFLAYVTRFFQPIQELSQLYTTMQAAMAGGERVLNLLDTESEVRDRENADTMPEIYGEIEFRNVRFHYTDEVEILHGINLHIESGQTVALVGPTGAGKTSIANLIARYYDVSEGAVCIDDIDVREVTQRSLRSQMGLVSQDPFLFAGTIADNIRFGDPSADMKAIEEAARAANVHEFIDALPDGYDTKILEDGANLSLGQRQLISIARALLADPRILIMDEATSSIDMVTEMLVQEALDRLLSDRTAIVIAHRLSTIINADVICVVEAGHIVEQGTHMELLEKRGLYHQLYERQFVEA